MANKTISKDTNEKVYKLPPLRCNKCDKVLTGGWITKSTFIIPNPFIEYCEDCESLNNNENENENEKRQINCILCDKSLKEYTNKYNQITYSLYAMNRLCRDCDTIAFRTLRKFPDVSYPEWIDNSNDKNAEDFMFILNLSLRSNREKDLKLVKRINKFHKLLPKKEPKTKEEIESFGEELKWRLWDCFCCSSFELEKHTKIFDNARDYLKTFGFELNIGYTVDTDTEDNNDDQEEDIDCYINNNNNNNVNIKYKNSSEITNN